MNPRVKIVKPQKDYKLYLEFDNGAVKVFDVKPFLSRGIFKELQNPEIFNSVQVKDGSVQWNNEADFCPDTLYVKSTEFSLIH